MTSPSARLRLFGVPSLSGADGAPMVGGVAEPHRIALLALLALHPKRTAARADLARYLWPARDAEQARQLLNQALFVISKALGDDAIFPSAKEVRLGSRVSVDALEFQSALEAGRPEDAVALYIAPLLQGFDLEDAPEFQNWAAAQRDRFATALRTMRPVAQSAVVEHDLPAPPHAAPAQAPPAHFPPVHDAPVHDAPTHVPPAESPAAVVELPEEVVLDEPSSSALPEEEPLPPPEPEVAKKPVVTAKRRRRSIPLPSARLVLTLLVLAVLGAGAFLAGNRILQGRAKARSLAVLPLEYSGRNAADAALAARITEELGPMLTRAGLIVTPSPTFARRGPPYDIRAIADSLNVGHVLLGVMRKDGTRVEFRFQLVNADDGVTRWDQTYRPRLADIPVLQEDVTATVAGQILGKARR